MQKNTEIQVVTISSDALSRKEQWIAKRDMLIGEAGAITEICCDADLEVSGSVQTQISKLIKELAEERVKITRPIDDVKKSIMDAEKEMVKSLSFEQGRIKGLNDAYATMRYKAEQARLEEERQKAREAAEAESARQAVLAKEAAELAANPFGDEAQFKSNILDCEPVVVPIPVFQKPATLGTNRQVTRWSYEVADPASVPHAFCSPDPKKIKAFMDLQIQLGNTPSMPGVRFESKISIESR